MLWLIDYDSFFDSSPKDLFRNFVKSIFGTRKYFQEAFQTFGIRLSWPLFDLELL